MRVAVLFLISALWSIKPASAAPSETASERFFNLTNLWSIHLTITPERWLAMEKIPPRQADGSDPNPPWGACTLQCAGQTLTNVSIRLKGSSSLAAAGLKRPFKIDINRGAKGRRLLGVKELSLNNNSHDESQFREAMAYEICRQAGLVAPRTAFAKVHLTIPGERTNHFLGLYTAVEQVDDEFLETHVGAKSGLLLKPERMPGLAYLGENWAAYTSRYQPKSDASTADTRRLVELARLAAQADDATLERELPTRVDMERFLRYVALMALMANFDSFVGNGHNYYLYFPANQGKALFIPWDMNEAFGGHPRAGSREYQTELTVLRPHSAQNRLIDRVLANPTWSAAYRRELNVLLKGAFAPDRLEALVRQLAAIVQEAVFLESPAAKASFQRVALGQSNAVEPAPPPGSPRPRPSSGGEPISFQEWLKLRVQNVAEELANKRTGKFPQPQGAPPWSQPSPPR